MKLFRPIFEALNLSGVRYVVVGGVAVVLQGHTRLTVDLDLIVDLEAAEAVKAIEALTDLGFQPQVPVPARRFADAEHRERWVEEKGMRVFSLIHPEKPLLTVDLFVRHPIPFEDLWDRAEKVTVENTDIQVASIPDLIRLKRQAGRSQDLADIERLEQILGSREESQ